MRREGHSFPPHASATGVGVAHGPRIAAGTQAGRDVAFAPTARVRIRHRFFLLFSQMRLLALSCDTGPCSTRDGRSTPRALRVRTRLRPAESDRARRRAMPPAHARHCVEATQVNGALDVVRPVYCGLGTPARCAAAWEVFNGARTRVSCRAPNPAGITHGATPLRVSKSASRRGSDRDVRRQSIDSPAGGLRASGRF